MPDRSMIHALLKNSFLLWYSMIMTKDKDKDKDIKHCFFFDMLFSNDVFFGFRYNMMGKVNNMGTSVTDNSTKQQ